MKQRVFTLIGLGVLALVLAAVAVAGTVTATATVTGAGALSLSHGTTASVTDTLDGTDQSVNYTLPLTMNDLRGSGAGWNLTMTSTTFNDGAGHVPGSDFGFLDRICGERLARAGGACTNPTNAISYPLTFPAAATAPAAVKVFNAGANTGMGRFTVTPSINVSIPGNSYAGSYASTLLRRGMSGFSNFAISFTIISILSGTLTLYGTGINYGGPIEEAYGWPLVSIFVIIVGLGMAEIASKYPTAGGLYYWASKMGGPVWGWFTGWFNLIGQIAITAGIDYGAAIFADALLNLLWPGTFKASPHEIIYVYACILGLHALMNIFSVKLVALLNDISVWWHVLGVGIIVGFLVFKPDHHQSFTTVFTKTVNNSGFSHHSSLIFVFVFMLGLLQAQYTFTGYDASAHMSEETQNASRSAARGVIMSIVVSAIFGYILALGVTFAIQNLPGTETAYLFSVKQVYLDSLGRKTAEVMLFITVMAQLYCGMSSITSASRMMYAFSRDGATPGHQLWRRLNAQCASPSERGDRNRRAGVPLRVPGVLHEGSRCRRRVCGVRRGHVDRHDRPLHRLCDPDLPSLERR